MVLFLRKRKILILALPMLLLLLLGGSVWLMYPKEGVYSFSPTRLDASTIIIDPGHGGEDGGAVSADGQKESLINLAIGERLDTLLRFYGVDTKLTREADSSIYDDTAKSLREKKRSDIQNRVKLVEETPGAVLISIHQNAYPNPKYGGMQLFFANEASRPLATQMQENVRIFLDEKNTRQALKIRPDVYLMSHVSCPAVLAECGFLSNERDAALLLKNDYQKKIAITIASACLSG